MHSNVFWRSCNTVSQRIMGTTTGSAVAKSDLSGMKPGQRAGFVRFGGVYHLLGVRVEQSGAPWLFFMDNSGKETKGKIIEGVDLYSSGFNSDTGPAIASASSVGMS